MVARIGIAAFAAMVIACAGQGGSRSAVQPKPAPADRDKFAALLRQLHAIDAELAAGTTRPAFDARVRAADAERRAVEPRARTDADVAAYNSCVEAIDAYFVAVALWRARDESKRYADHYAKTQATFNHTARQLDAMAAGRVKVEGELAERIKPYRVGEADIDGATFVPADAMDRVVARARAATDEAERLTR